MATSNTVFSNTPNTVTSPYPVFVNSTTGAIEHFNGTQFTQVGGYAPSATGTVNLSSGVAVQNTAPCFATYHIVIAGVSTGTVAVAIGNTSACSNVIVPATANNAANNHVMSIRVPAGWYLKVTVTNGATIATGTTILTEGTF